MNDNQTQRGARQERIARESLPKLSVLADKLDALTREVFETRIPFQPDNGADVMVLSFVTKQCEHLLSVRTLIDANSHRDALLIARTMIEGLGRLLWAFKGEPERTDLWFWYGVILDWRQTTRNEETGSAVDPQDKAELKAYVDRYGPNYYRPSIRKQIEAAKRDGTVYQIPDDPWGTNWTDYSVSDMFTEVGGKPIYDKVYRDTSEWIHWGPRSILRAMESAEWGMAGFTEEDWRAAAVALQTGCQSLQQSLEVLDMHFSLGIALPLADLNHLMSTALAESLAAGDE